MKFRKILCPVDFFPASEQAVAYAAQLAAAHNARLKLLHVVAPVITSGYEFAVNTAPLQERLETGSERQLRRLLKRCQLPGLRLEGVVKQGDIFTEITAAIEGFKPDLVAMGSHGYRGFERWILGSTAERVMRHSPVPVLMVSGTARSKDPARFSRIMIATDLSGTNAEAFRYALAIAGANQAHITLFHVLEEARAITSADYREKAAIKAQRELMKLVPKSVLESCEIDAGVGAGTPYHVLLAAVKKLKVDLLVMNTHGKGIVDRVLVGSTADRVTRAATCSVLLIPSTGRKKTAQKE